MNADLDPDAAAPAYAVADGDLDGDHLFLSGIQQSHLGKRTKGKEVKEEKKWKLPNRIFPNFPMIPFYNTI